jgi:thiamine biosynthesis lipoprotein
MGTAFEMTVSKPSRDAALEASEAALREMRRVEALLSTWRDGGPLARLNAATPELSVSVPAELFDLLKKVFEWSERTGGAFDPTVLPLVRAWGLRRGGHIPTPRELRAARDATGRPLFLLEEFPFRVSRKSAAAGIDEGAWGKGYALDRAANVLREHGVSTAVLDLGGQVLSLGEAGIDVDVAHPRDRARIVGHLHLRSGSLSTSGNSERSVSAAGRRIGHLLDPRTGGPAEDFGSVTVVAPSALVADILSTAFFVLGPEKGMTLSARLRGEGVTHDCLFFIECKEGQSLRAIVSPGMRRLLRDKTFATAPPARRDTNRFLSKEGNP